MDKDYLLDLMVNVREKTIPVDEAVETICALADDDTGAEQCNLPVIGRYFMEIKFKPKQKVWMMYDNKPTCAPITEIRLNSKVEYYFWHQDFPTKDESMCCDNTFRVNEDRLFETKEALINAL